MNSDEAYAILRTSKPFIYEISGKFYVIGACVFRLCTVEEANEYEEYRIELDKIVASNIQPKKFEVEKLRDITFKILRDVDVNFSDSGNADFSRIFSEFEEENKSVDWGSLVRQRDLLSEALDYADGAFYRHYGVNGKRIER